MRNSRLEMDALDPSRRSGPGCRLGIYVGLGGGLVGGFELPKLIFVIGEFVD